MELLSGVSQVEVTRFPFLNGGSMWAVTFATGSGDMESLHLNSTGLVGTQLSTLVLEDTAGNALDGTYRLYTGGGYASGFPLDANLIHIEKKGGNNGSGRSDPLEWNAKAEDVQSAINGLLPEYSSEGGIPYIVLMPLTCLRLLGMFSARLVCYRFLYLPL